MTSTMPTGIYYASQCDMLVALPELGHGHKALCPRCGTTLTTEMGRARDSVPFGVCAGRVVLLLLSNLFPFIYMKVGRDDKS